MRPPKVGEEVLVRLHLHGVSRYERATVIHVGWNIRVMLVGLPQFFMMFSGELKREHEGSGWIRRSSSLAKSWAVAQALLS